MRQTSCGEIRTSVLGFGCGSVLGRVGRAASLRAMHAAWNAGVTFFDTARSYGYGEAEAVLGEFLQGRRDGVIVATKYGIAPAKLSAMRRVAIPVVRATMQVPGVRSMMRRGGGSPQVQHGTFSADGLRSSVETSLRELRTDRIDVLFLHDATPAVLAQEDVMAELAGLIQAGKVLRVGLYGEAETAAAGIQHGPAILRGFQGAMQYGADPFDPVVAGIPAIDPRGTLLIGNHPFGSEQRVGRIKALLTAMSRDPAIPAALREKLIGDDWRMSLEAILGMALSSGLHALVFSMMREDHLRANVLAMESNRFTPEELAVMRGRMLASAR